MRYPHVHCIQQWTNYSCPIFIDFQTSCLSLYSKLSIYRLFVYVLLLEIQLSRVECWGPINLYNSATFVCLSQTRIWISNVTCFGLSFSFHWVQLRWEVIFRFVWYWLIWYHHCLNTEGTIKNGQRSTTKTQHCMHINTKNVN